MKRSKLYRATCNARHGVSYVWDHTRRINSNDAGTNYWYLRLRVEGSYLFNDTTIGELSDIKLEEYANRLIKFAMVLVALEDIVVNISADTNVMYDDIENLGLAL